MVDRAGFWADGADLAHSFGMDCEYSAFSSHVAGEYNVRRFKLTYILIMGRSVGVTVAQNINKDYVFLSLLSTQY